MATNHFHRILQPKLHSMSDAYKITDQHGIYFLTFTIVGWADIFTRASYRHIVADSFNFCTEKKRLVCTLSCL